MGLLATVVCCVDVDSTGVAGTIGGAGVGAGADAGAGVGAPDLDAI